MAYSANPNLFVESFGGGLRTGSAITDLIRRKRDDRELQRLAQLAKQGQYEELGAGLIGMGEVGPGIAATNVPYNREQQRLQQEFQNQTMLDNRAFRERDWNADQSYRNATLDLARTKMAQEEEAAALAAQAEETKAADPRGYLDDERKLATEFKGQTKDFPTTRDSYAKIKATASDTSAAGDLALIFSFMKILDPGSVVREQEFANAQNAAGVPDRVRNLWNQVLSGERLNTNQRSDFLKQAENLYKSQEAAYTKTKSEYEKIANKYGLDPTRIFADAIMSDADFNANRLIPAPPPPGSPAGVDDALVNDLINRYGGR